MAADNGHRASTYYKEAILKKEGRTKWTEYYAVLTGRSLVFTKQDEATGTAIPHNRTSLELSRKTTCGYSRKTCYRFPFYVQTDRGTYYFKCETNLQRYRWIYAIRLASSGKMPEPAPKFIPTTSAHRSKSTQAGHLQAGRSRENLASANDNNNNHNNGIHHRHHHNNNNNNNNNRGDAGRPLGNGNAHNHRRVALNDARQHHIPMAANNIGYVPDHGDGRAHNDAGAGDWQLHSCTSSESENDQEDDSRTTTRPRRRQRRVEPDDQPRNNTAKMDCRIEDLESDSGKDEGFHVAEAELRSRRGSVLSATEKRRCSRSEEAIAGSRLGSSARVQVMSQESVVSAEAKSFAMYAPTRYSDTMKSQSWTSVRSPINTTRRRESSAPSLRSTLRNEDIAEVV